MLQEPEAIRILEEGGFAVLRELKPGDEQNVIATVLAFGAFTVADAAQFPNLRTVARFGAGYDNIDARGLWDSRKISVSCTPDLSNRDVADLALALTILATRAAPRDIKALGAEKSAWRVIERRLSLSDSTIGIVGCGHIGMETARLIAPLAGRTLLWNRTRKPEIDLAALRGRCEWVDSLDDVAARSDVVSLHVFLNEQTRNMIGAPFFARLKAVGRSIALVNTGRGELVDEAALLQALDDGVVHDAAIDVWSAEGAKTSEVVLALRRHPAVLPTSHLGAYTTGVRHRYAMQVSRNIVALVDGKPEDVAGFVVDPR